MAESYIAKPEFKSVTVFNENLVALELRKLQIHLNKPIYVRQAILDLAKPTIYSFHYDYMIPKFGDNYTVCYTDTDSVIVEIRGKDPYEAMRQDCYKYFDTSDYATNNIFGIPLVNKKVPGWMKDENNGRIMTDYIELKSKLYTTRVTSTEYEVEKLRGKLKYEEYEHDEILQIIKNFGVTKKAKVVKKSVITAKIIFEDYEECLENFVKKTASQNLIRSTKHQVYSIKQEKLP